MTPAAKPCLFCAIVRGDEPASMVYADEHTVAFLDAHPLFKGHVLVLPRAHHETLLELPRELLAPYYGTVQRAARAVTEALAADGTFVAQNNVVSQSVPHMHTHVVPRRKKDGLRGFFWPRQRYGEGEREAFAARIHAAMSS